MKEPKSRSKKKSVFREYTEVAVIALLLLLFIRTFVVQAFKIPSKSMDPALIVGDHILINKFIYGIKIPFTNKTLIPIGDPKRDDVIVFAYPADKSKDLIKRVIGLPGDRVEMKGQIVFINGEIFEDNHGVYTDDLSSRKGLVAVEGFGPVTVPEEHLFVLGDNRDHSSDSRFYGFIPFDAVKGKAFIIYWSWPIWKRFLNAVD